MTTLQKVNQTGSTLVVVISVVATILALLGAAVEYTQHLSRVADRSRKIAVATEIADGHLEYLFSSWRNIHRVQTNVVAPLATQYFPTVLNSNLPAPNGNPGAPGPIPTPPASLFATVPSYQVTQYRIQAVNPMVDLDANGTSLLDVSTNPPRALGPNSLANTANPQRSYFYLASVDVDVPVLNGSVSAKVRRVFEKKLDVPWAYAMFFNDDLELHPSASMTVDGPIMTNNNLYISTSNLTATTKVSYAGEYVNGYSPNDTTHTATPTTPNFAKSKSTLAESDCPPSEEGALTPWGWNIDFDTGTTPSNQSSYRELIEIPIAGAADEFSTYRYYNQADVKVLIDSSNTVKIYNANNVLCTSSSTGTDKNIFTMVSAALTKDIAFQDNRENTYVRVADFDLSVVKDYVESFTNTSKQMPTSFKGIIYIADTSTNGTNISSKIGGNGSSVTTTERGVRLTKGYSLPAANTSYYTNTNYTNGGLTIVSPNPVYIAGNFNTADTPSATLPSNNGDYTSTMASGYAWRPASVFADSINLLSKNWSDLNSTAGITNRTATNTTVNAALVSGNVPSGNGKYSGGGENFIRLLEDWSNKTLCYKGSMVQLFTSQQGAAPYSSVTSIFKSPATIRWLYDPKFGLTASPPGNLSLASYLQQQRWYQVY